MSDNLKNNIGGAAVSKPGFDATKILPGQLTKVDISSLDDTDMANYQAALTAEEAKLQKRVNIWSHKIYMLAQMRDDANTRMTATTAKLSEVQAKRASQIEPIK